MSPKFNRLIRSLLIALPALALATSPVLASSTKHKHTNSPNKTMASNKSHSKKHTTSPS